VGLGRSDSPYMTVVTICIESFTLIVVFSLIYFILAFDSAHLNSSFTGFNGSVPFHVSMQLLVHVYVLSPLLIVYRVAKGKAVTIKQRRSESGPVVSALQF